MAFFKTTHERKSTVITTSILVVLVLLVFNFGLTYLDPPEEYGLAINFGDANVGQGEPIVQTKKVTPEVTKLPEEEVVEEIIPEKPKESVTEEILTEENSEEVPVVEKKQAETNPEEVQPKETPKPKPKPKPSKEAADALQNLLQGTTSDGKPKGEGDDTVAGTKGATKGDATSKKFYGKAGSGEDGNYNLDGRTALTKPIQKPDCQEEGRVVVRIEVDRNGRVINAIPGVKGSTNTAACLLKPAKEAALRTTWNADPNAEEKQIGTIIYDFTLTK